MKIIGQGRIEPKDKTQLWYKCQNWVIYFRTENGKISKDFSGSFTAAQAYKNQLYKQYSSDYKIPGSIFKTTPVVKKPSNKKGKSLSLSPKSLSDRNKGVDRYSEIKRSKIVGGNRELNPHNPDVLDSQKLARGRSEKSNSNKDSKKLLTPKNIVIAIIIVATVCVAVVLFNLWKTAQVEAQKQAEIQLAEEQAAQEEQRSQEEAKRLYTQMRTQKAKTAVKNIKSLGTLYKNLNVPIMYQYPVLPSGCEAVALTNQLNYYGFNLDLTTIADEYMPYSSDDFVNAYVGDPYQEIDGTTIMAPGLTVTANNYLDKNSANLYAYDITGLEFTDLFSYIERGHPVQIWVTLQMMWPDDAYDIQDDLKFTTYNHCVLLTGFNKNDNTVQIADSIYGTSYYSIDRVKSVWDYLGQQAVVILSDKEVDAFIKGDDASYDGSVS